MGVAEWCSGGLQNRVKVGSIPTTHAKWRLCNAKVKKNHIIAISVIRILSPALLIEKEDGPGFALSLAKQKSKKEEQDNMRHTNAEFMNLNV